MAKILVVDDDKNFLLSLADGLSSYNEKFKVLTAENGKEALDVLRDETIDLMITDLKMPEMDGFELLAHMVPNYPDIPVIVMTAFANPEMENQLMNMGSFMFLEKPLDFHVLVEKIKEGMDIKSRYVVKVLSLFSYLQMLEFEKKTCTVSIRSHGRKGSLYFHEGVLIDGETKDASGPRAVYDIVAWEAVEVEIDGECKKIAGKDTIPLNFILREESLKQAQRQRGAAGADELYSETAEFPNGVQAMVQNAVQNTVQDVVQDTVQPKETDMNVTKLSQAMDVLKIDLGDALLWAGIVEQSQGRLVVDYRANLKAGVLLSQITGYLKKGLTDCKLPNLGRFYLIELMEEKVLIAIPFHGYEWGIAVDLAETTLGLFLNITLPKIINAFEEAVGG